MLTAEGFMRHIKDWMVYAQKHLYTMKDRPDLTCFELFSGSIELSSGQALLAVHK